MLSRARRGVRKEGHRTSGGALRKKVYRFFYHLPVRRIRFRRLGVPLRAMQSPRLFACGRFLSLPLSCLGPSRIAKQPLRLAVERRNGVREIRMRTSHIVCK
jgi:hypothetical protein